MNFYMYFFRKTLQVKCCCFFLLLLQKQYCFIEEKKTNDMNDPWNWKCWYAVNFWIFTVFFFILKIVNRCWPNGNFNNHFYTPTRVVVVVVVVESVKKKSWLRFLLTFERNWLIYTFLNVPAIKVSGHVLKEAFKRRYFYFTKALQKKWKVYLWTL